MSNIYPGGDSPVTPNLGLSLVGMDEVIAEDFILVDAAIAAGTSIQINGTVIPHVNLNDTTPVAPVFPAGSTNVVFQVSGPNVSAYVPISAFSGNAAFLQGIPVSPTGPTPNQLLQFNGTSWAPAVVAGASLYNVAYSTDFIWSRTAEVGFGALTAGVPATISILSAPLGFDASGRACTPYWIYISGVGTPEAVRVTGGTATPGLPGTITFTPFFSHGMGYTIGTATAGIQEALNFAAGVSPTPYLNAYAKVVVPPSPTPYNVYATITMCTTESILEGHGATLAYTGRGPCLQVGDLTNANDANANTVSGLTFRPPTTMSAVEYVGSLVTSTQRTSGVSTIHTSAPHGFRVGDSVTILFTDEPNFWGDVPAIATVPTTSSFTYASTGRGDTALRTTPGVVALMYICVLDNANDTRFVDIKTDYLGAGGAFNGVFDIWDDENCTIENFTNNGVGLNCNINWTPSYVASYGAANIPNHSQQLAAVISLNNASITANRGNGVTFFNNNGLYINDTVIQASGPWQVNTSNIIGNFQTVAIRNLYSESNASLNPVSPASSPWPGCGIAGMIIGPSTNASGPASIRGNGSVSGQLPTVGSGSVNYVYYVVINDVTAGTHSAPMPVMGALSNGGAVTVSWPRVSNGADVITYDVLRSGAGTFGGVDDVAPYTGGCPGGSVVAMGSVVVGQVQQAGFVQTFSDNTTVATSAYATVSSGNYAGNLVFWPGTCTSVVTPVNSDFTVPVMATGMRGNPSNISMFTLYGETASPTIATTISTSWDAGNSIRNHQALLLNDGVNNGGNGSPNTKGRLNFQTSGLSSIAAGHIITLVDSNPLKTRAYALNRPPNDAADTFIGIDGGSGATNASSMSIGNPVAISHYINNIGDGTNWLERLTATLKTIKTAVNMPNLTIHANNAAAVGAGLSVGTLYRTGADPSLVCVVF